MLSFEGIKCKQYKKHSQDKKSRNLQAFVQGRLLFLSLFPPPQNQILKSTVFWIFNLSWITGVCFRLQKSGSGQFNLSICREDSSSLQAQGTHTVVTHKGPSHTTVRVPNNPLVFYRKLWSPHVVLLLPFHLNFRRDCKGFCSFVPVNNYIWKLLAYLSCEKDVEMLIKRQHWVISYSLQELV